jgi:hypothetical protein
MPALLNCVINTRKVKLKWVQKREKRATKRYPKLTKPKEIKEEIWIVY